MSVSEVQKPANGEKVTCCVELTSRLNGSLEAVLADREESKSDFFRYSIIARLAKLGRLSDDDLKAYGVDKDGNFS